MSKGLKLLKYIMRDKDLRRIPVIMMSAQDEVSVVFKCLKFGAADYLVKPLRTNELLNLWTHMWRRRRTLGLAEKNIMSYDFDLVVSDPSDANTNSTTLFSDDTDDRSRKSVNPDACASTQQEEEIIGAINDAPLETIVVVTSQCLPDVPGIKDRRTGQVVVSFPRKSELKIGESSAFFTYVKANLPINSSQDAAPLHESVPQPMTAEEKLETQGQHMIVDSPIQNGGVAHDASQGEYNPSSNSMLDSFSVERSCTPTLPLEFSQQRNSNEFSQVLMHQRNEQHHDVSGFHQHTAYPYYIPGVMNQVIVPAPPMYQKNLPDLHNHAAVLPQYNHHIPQCPPHVPGMSPFPYYPFGMCAQPGQMSSSHPWPSYGNTASAEGNVSKIDRREAALMKFRQKRKERCFDKKIRYVNRKKLAERRPRVRGQFVRKINGISVDLNGQPASADDEDDEDEDEDEEDQVTNLDSSPDDDSSVCQR
ncbi:OLC1v1012431C3 [Oldenlandia corymbosa var. corymbosa]|nr:OLC1v1012431C3 [Oldenlandia corymbosa var. corymbosa]